MAAANREAVMASIETFPLQRQIEAASRIGGEVRVPIYKNGKETGEYRTVNFSGMSDIDATRETARALASLAPEQTKAQLDLAKEYGTQFAEQRLKELKAADPKR